MTSHTPLPLGDLAKISSASLPGFNLEKPAPGFWSSNPIFSFVIDAYSGFSDHRKTLGLMNPGTVENLSKEVTHDVLTKQYFFTGLKADVMKIFSLNPAFQVGHSLSIGSKSLPPYNFMALFANDTCFAQGVLDNELSLNGRFHYNWSKEIVSKMVLQMPNGQPSLIQLEQEIQGHDHTLSLKALNPFYLNGDFSGMLTGSILQSITKKLAVGFEAFYSKQAEMPPDAAISYFGRYDAKDWIATAQIQAQGALNATYWRKISDKLEAGLETELQAAIVPILDPILRQPIGFDQKVEGNTTLGVKYQFRQSIFRGSVASDGKVTAFLEKKILPSLSVLFSGEIDHMKNTSRLGLGVQFEIPGNEQIWMIQQGMLDENGNPLPGAPQLA